MKHTKRKLLSLLLALAMMFSLMSAGLAASIYDYLYGYGYGSGYDYSGYQSVGVTSGGSKEITPQFPQYIMTALGPAQLGGIEWNSANDNSGITVSGSGNKATVSAASGSTNYTSTQATATAYYYLTSGLYAGVADTATFYYDIRVGATDGTPVYNYNNGYGSIYNPSYPSYPNYPIYPDSGSTSTGYVTSMQGSMSLAVGGSNYLQITPYLSSSNSVQISSVYWTSSNPAIATVSGSNSYATVTGVASGTALISAYVSGTYYNGSTWQNFVNELGCTVTVGTGIVNTDLFISPSTLQVGVGDYDVLTASSYNTTVQGYLNNVTWQSSNPSVASISYYNNSLSNSATGSSVYVYGQSAGYATITATLTVGAQTYTATCDVVVGSGNQVDILYTTTAGSSLTLNVSDFQKFWTDSNPYGTLYSVAFGTPTGTVGSLKYTNSYNQQVSAAGQTFYVSPSTYQYNSLSGVSFVPTNYASTYNSTGTLVVPFTAYGYTSSSSYTTASLSGKMYIMVSNGTVADINYQFSSAGVKLSSADFTSVYKTAVSSASTYPTYYIQFLDVPAFGSLYYNYYSNSVYGQGYGTKLTASNIGTMRFGNYTGAYSIDSLTYIPGTYNSGETIRYIAYSSASGGTPLYMGEINFGKGAASSNVVKYITTVGKTITFDGSDFYTGTSYYGSDYISFGTPSSGTLYKSSGTYVSASDVFVAGTYATQANSVDNVYFVPKTGFTGVVEIPYTASGLTNNSQYSGTVKLYYSNAFPDVKPDWAYDYIMQMSAEGIVTGYKGLFNPDGKVTYGEALKMIMEATGYSSTNATTGHWANNYLNLAYRKGLVSTTNIDLNTAIDRNAVAAIAAKALGLKAVTNTATSPFADSKDGYVLALYNAGIIEGSTVGTKSYYYGSNDISRKEISKIICLISDYNG